jgi:hypothetical protein
MGCQGVKGGTLAGVGIGLPPLVSLQCGNLEILHQGGVDGGGECGPGRLLDMGDQHLVDVGAHRQGPLHGLCHTTGHYHSRVVGRLPAHHRDPFDRMLVAQATVEGLALVTRDADIQRYEVDLLVV